MSTPSGWRCSENSATIKKSRTMFAMHGFPNKLVIDNITVYQPGISEWDPAHTHSPMTPCIKWTSREECPNIYGVHKEKHIKFTRNGSIQISLPIIELPTHNDRDTSSGADVQQIIEVASEFPEPRHIVTGSHDTLSWVAMTHCLGWP